MTARTESLEGLLGLIALGALIYFAGALYIGYFLLGFAGLGTLVFFWSLLTCDGGGCVSGLMLLPIILVAILGLILVGIGLS